MEEPRPSAVRPVMEVDSFFDSRDRGARTEPASIPAGTGIVTTCAPCAASSRT